MTPSLTVSQDGNVTVLAADWWDRSVALTSEAIQAIFSAAERHNALSCLASQARVHIRLDAHSCSRMQERVTEILADPASWKTVGCHPRWPRELMVVRGRDGSREWSYEKQLAPMEVEVALEQI
jgi:hypothetical protein